MEKLGQPEHPLKLLARRASKMHHPFFFRSPKKKKKKKNTERERRMATDFPWKGTPGMGESERWSLVHFLGKMTASIMQTVPVLIFSGEAGRKTCHPCLTRLHLKSYQRLRSVTLPSAWAQHAHRLSHLVFHMYAFFSPVMIQGWFMESQRYLWS